MIGRVNLAARPSVAPTTNRPRWLPPFQQRCKTHPFDPLTRNPELTVRQRFSPKWAVGPVYTHSMWTLRTGLFFSILLLANGQTVDPRDQGFWNKKFADPKTGFKREPSPLLVDAIHGRRPGRALDLGMGEGRNTIYLAEQGRQSRGVDLSDVAVAQARTRASQLHMAITGIADDLTHYELGRGQWDLIAAFYMHAWYNGTRPEPPLGSSLR